MQITDYVKPELIVVALVLYFVGMWIKQSEAVKDRYIPDAFTASSVLGRKLSASPLFQNMRTRTFGICLPYSSPTASTILIAKSKTTAAVSSLMK